MRQGNIKLTVSGSALAGTSMASSFTTDAINLISIYAYSIQITWASGTSPAGTFKLQGSNDPGDTGSGQAVSVPTHFTDITNASQAISGTPGSVLFDITQCSYRWVRLVYTAASGSATIGAANINAKGV
jgi:hypothetical protein